MAEKIIRLPQLQRFKTNADAKYQDKLTAGTGITISGNTVSVTNPVQPVFYVTVLATGWSGTSNAVTVQGITSSDNIEIIGFNPTGLSDTQAAAVYEALSLITYGSTSIDTITFYALNGSVPDVNIPLILRKLV